MGISNATGITEITPYIGAFSGGAAGGIATALTLTIPNFSQSIGNFISFIPTITSTGPGVTTLTINGGTPVPIKNESFVGLIDIADGDFSPGLPVVVTFDGTVYVALNLGYYGIYVDKSSNFSPSLADIFNSINATNPITITLAAASTYAFYFYVNILATNGDVTLTPNGTDTIQGVNASFIIKSGTSIRLYTDGVSAWKMNGVGSVGANIVVASGRFTAQVAAKAAVVAYTVPVNEATFLVSSNVLVTASVTHSFTTTVTYTDEGNTSRTLTLPYSQLAGTIITAITNVTGVGPYEGVPLQIRAKASTTITFATVGTFTSVAYNVECYLTRIG